MTPHQDVKVSLLIELLGGVSKLAKLCKLTKSSVSLWKETGISRGYCEFLRTLRPSTHEMWEMSIALHDSPSFEKTIENPMLVLIKSHKTIKELAGKIGKNPSTVRSWVDRQCIPAKYSLEPAIVSAIGYYYELPIPVIIGAWYIKRETDLCNLAPHR